MKIPIKLILLTSGLFFAVQSGLLAKHIIGGDISYSCLGNGNYQITMKIYRDCRDPEAAPYDPFAKISVFRRLAGGRLENISPINSVGNRSFEIGIDEEFDIQADLNNPCLTIPDNLCVQQGTYGFSLQLPLINGSYFITYQRCCRNVTINNIRDPDETGATFSMEITEAAQISCNNSPVFNDFPPIVICSGEDINFDHSARDNENDSLVYYFCSPWIGGGQGGSGGNGGDPAAPNGVAPDPPLPPPYINVDFVSPPYSISNPMAGNPQVRIDSITGLISGVPVIVGQYVVGVCVEEYRNGELLSLTRRDFQFNVENCQPTVVADIAEDVKIGARDFVINSCGNNTINFINQSFQEQNIVSYLWEFNIENQIQSYTSKDVTVTFPDTGQYRAIMIVNPGITCADTADIFVNIFPEITADFSFDYDTCIAGPLLLDDNSVAGAPIQNWLWDFGEGSLISQREPTFEYQVPGDFDITLSVTDINGCTDSTSKPISYFPVPALIVVEPSAFQGCAPELVLFDNLSFPIDSTYDITWQFGDGNISNEISPTYLYETPGNFSVFVEIISPLGCQTEQDFSNLIRIRPSPTAAFSFSPQMPNSINNTVQFTNNSLNEDRVFWDFENIGTSTVENPSMIFPDTGVYQIRLIAEHQSGCLDTAIQIIDIEPFITFHMPNAFTPNLDDVNDTFKGKGILAGVSNYRMTIWNRWGELIFESTDPDVGWNGRKNNAGEYLISGVYLYVVNFDGPRNENHEFKGYATLIR